MQSTPLPPAIQIAVALLAVFAHPLPASTAPEPAPPDSENSVAVSSVEVEAPFDMPAIQTPDFSGAAVYAITDFGAKSGDSAATSHAISTAITRASESGGGVVRVPPGDWETGPIHLRDNVCLQVDEGATLKFSEDPAEYLPAVKTTWEGMECYNYSPLIYAYGCKNIAVVGGGKLHARLSEWQKWYARPRPHLEALQRLYEMASTGVPVEQRQMAVGEANLRPQFLQFNRCENVLVEGVTVQNSPFWVIHPYLSKNVVIRNVSVHAKGHNNDGVDPEMCQNVLIEGCDFNQGDDAISVKSGRNHDAWRLATPSRNIVIRDCRIRNGHQLAAIGSELSGGVENVLIEDCVVDDRADLMHLLFIKTNERRGGFARGIHMRRITAGDLRYGVLGIETDVLYQWKNLVPTHEVRHTAIAGIHVEDVSVGRVKFICRIEGCEEAPVDNVSLASVAAREVSGAGLSLRNVARIEYSSPRAPGQSVPVREASRDAGQR